MEKSFTSYRSRSAIISDSSDEEDSPSVLTKSLGTGDSLAEDSDVNSLNTSVTSAANRDILSPPSDGGVPGSLQHRKNIIIECSSSDEESTDIVYIDDDDSFITKKNSGRRVNRIFSDSDGDEKASPTPVRSSMERVGNCSPDFLHKTQGRASEEEIDDSSNGSCTELNPETAVLPTSGGSQGPVLGKESEVVSCNGQKPTPQSKDMGVVARNKSESLTTDRKQGGGSVQEAGHRPLEVVENSETKKVNHLVPAVSVPQVKLDITSALQSLSVADSQESGFSAAYDIMERRRLVELEIEKLKREITKTKVILKTVNLTSLPDNGVRLQMKVTNCEKALKMKERELSEIRSIKLTEIPKPAAKVPSQNNGVVAGPGQALGNSGPKIIEVYNKEKALTVERLKQLHGSLESCPTEDMFANDPDGLKPQVTLMAHQKHALAWLSWREKQRPRGGILADDMGLGKTLTMISLVLKSQNESVDGGSSDDDDKGEDFVKPVKGGTLVVCPASLLNQWSGEVQQHCRSHVLDVEIHHGSNRTTSVRHLARWDMVITTYQVVRSEAEARSKGRGTLFRILWKRIVLDEAHVIRNHKSKQSVAVCDLQAKCRWALTGTPIHNTELDLFALLKFLRCSPFDDYPVWRRWVDNKNATGLKRLNTVMKSIMLRRTKDVLKQQGPAHQQLPEKMMFIIDVKLDKQEFAVYEKLLFFSRTLFAQFLHQRMEKQQSLEGSTSAITQNNKPGKPFESNSELEALRRKVMNMPKVKSYQILMLLLRLRQICNHPGLMKKMLSEDADVEVGILEDSHGTDADLASQLGGLSLDGPDPVDGEIAGMVLSVHNPVFDTQRVSSKMKVLFEKLEENVLCSTDKAIIVSQWTTMLGIMHKHLCARGVRCHMLSGQVHIRDRMKVVECFNRPSHKPEILLLSLTAGGVGLNLTGANHLFMFDNHWNPQLEVQACDRIFRIGQKKKVHVYRFICTDTIEQRIKVLQDNKLSLANDLLTGAMHKNTAKLSLDDLRMLFSM